ncbi:MAG: hypothetical protein Q8K32_32980 [Archangium sp.]|nr:hypothetical protein [Archangium sp.]
MTSACGDGWNNPDAGEACDDKNALNSGGCTADCRAVSPGYVCGAGAAGCSLAPIDAGQPATDAGVSGGTDAGSGVTDAGSVVEEADAGLGRPGEPMPRTGCSAIGTELLFLAGLLLRRRSSARSNKSAC